MASLLLKRKTMEVKPLATMRKGLGSGTETAGDKIVTLAGEKVAATGEPALARRESPGTSGKKAMLVLPTPDARKENERMLSVTPLAMVANENPADPIPTPPK
jgi:hypothetical protein